MERSAGDCRGDGAFEAVLADGGDAEHPVVDADMRKDKLVGQYRGHDRLPEDRGICGLATPGGPCTTRDFATAWHPSGATNTFL